MRPLDAPTKRRMAVRGLLFVLLICTVIAAAFGIGPFLVAAGVVVALAWLAVIGLLADSTD